jgi:phospholipase/carboxylesterase
MSRALGIHHLTLITRKVQANVDFYAGFLGLRLVKRTGGFEDSAQLHLIYGDAEGSPGSLVTFLVWEDGGQGRVGFGQTLDMALAIDPESIGFWLTRALQHGIKAEGPAMEFGEPVIRFKDPDGVIVKLVGTHSVQGGAPHVTRDIPAEHAISRIRAATILTEVPEETESFFTRHFDLTFSEESGTIRRLTSSSGDALDIRDATGFWSSAPGTGTFDHVALRALDMDELETVHTTLKGLNSSDTNAHDRKYFQSFYVREPGGTLIEMATDGPGMTVDEPLEQLGQTLFIPPSFMRDEQDLKVALPQFGLPGEERVIYRELPFVHRFYIPEDPDGTTLVLLHGSGGSESSLMPLAHRANPRATLLGIRGRSTEEGIARWFRRSNATIAEKTTFDQADIRTEAEAFAAFVQGARNVYGIDPDYVTVIGHSNGANFYAAFASLYPKLARRALLYRAMPVLDDWPEVDLLQRKMQIVAGEIDYYFPHGKALYDILQSRNADISFQSVQSGHELVREDIDVAKKFLL